MSFFRKHHKPVQGNFRNWSEVLAYLKQEAATLDWLEARCSLFQPAMHTRYLINKAVDQGIVRFCFHDVHGREIIVTGNRP